MLQIYFKSQEFGGNNLYIFSLLLRPPFATELFTVGMLTQSLNVSNCRLTHHLQYYILISRQTAPHKLSWVNFGLSRKASINLAQLTAPLLVGHSICPRIWLWGDKNLIFKSRRRVSWPLSLSLLGRKRLCRFIWVELKYKSCTVYLFFILPLLALHILIRTECFQILPPVTFYILPKRQKGLPLRICYILY